MTTPPAQVVFVVPYDYDWNNRSIRGIFTDLDHAKRFAAEGYKGRETQWLGDDERCSLHEGTRYLDWDIERWEVTT